jgi:hypothetical protein
MDFRTYTTNRDWARRPHMALWTKARKLNVCKGTTDGSQTGNQVRSIAEEDGKDPDRIEGRQEEKVI